MWTYEAVVEGECAEGRCVEDAVGAQVERGQLIQRGQACSSSGDSSSYAPSASRSALSQRTSEVSDVSPARPLGEPVRPLELKSSTRSRRSLESEGGAFESLGPMRLCERSRTVSRSSMGTEGSEYTTSLRTYDDNDIWREYR